MRIVETDSRAGAPRPLAFLDTSVLFILLGCSDRNAQRVVRGYQLAIHQVHYDEAVRRLHEAVIQLLNTGQDGDRCLMSLAQRVLQKLKLKSARASSLRSMGRLVRKVRQESQRLLNNLIESHGILILDDGAEGPRNDIKCPGLSYEDTLLVNIAIECNAIVSTDNDLISCCLDKTGSDITKCLNLNS